MLTEPGLSTIVTAIIGARKIFQRMNTYAKYTIAMTFRICLTFGVLTVVYDWSAFTSAFDSSCPVAPGCISVDLPVLNPPPLNTYAKYIVAITFHVCLTFGVLTVVYDRSPFPSCFIPLAR